MIAVEADGISLDHLPDLGDLPATVSRLDDDELLVNVGLGVGFEAFGLLGDRFPTPRTVLVVGCECLPAVPTVPAVGRRLVSLLADASLLVDRVVQLLAFEVDVPTPHRGVERPADPMLDLLFRESLAVHPRDGAVSEVVRVRRLVDVSLLPGLSEAATHVLGGHCRLAIFEAVCGRVRADEAVEQRRVLIVRLGMGIAEVRPQRGDAVDQRVIVLRGVLQPRRLGVGFVVWPVRIQLDVGDAERADHRGARSRVGEELDHRDVAGLRHGVDERADVVLREHIVRGDATLGRRSNIEIVGPLPIKVLEEHTQPLSVVAEGVFAHPAASSVSVVAFILEEDGVDVVLRGLGERRLDALGGQPDATEVFGHRRDGEAAVGVTDPLPDQLLVGVVDRVRIDGLQFGVELPIEVLKVVHVAHVPHPMAPTFVTVYVQNPFGIGPISRVTSADPPEENRGYPRYHPQTQMDAPVGHSNRGCASA